jgi:hypothetical protein
MIAEHINEYGTKFKCFDDVNIIVDSEQYIYHIVNRGKGGRFGNFIESHHVTEAIVAASDTQAAVDLLTNENLGAHETNYIFEVYRIGADMQSNKGERFILYTIKPSLE